MLSFTEPSAIYLLPCTTKLHFLEPGFPHRYCTLSLTHITKGPEVAQGLPRTRSWQSDQDSDGLGFADSENSNAFGNFARGSGAIQQRRTRGSCELTLGDLQCVGVEVGKAKSYLDVSRSVDCEYYRWLAGSLTQRRRYDTWICSRCSLAPVPRQKLRNRCLHSSTAADMRACFALPTLR